MRQLKYIALAGWIFFSLAAFSQRIEKSAIRYLALGDSYTIGEGVQEAERWPNQLVEELRKNGIATTELTNIAQTGWTTSNLLSYVGVNNADSGYDLVSLLIGVNNQFQGRSINTYRDEFRTLLKTAVAKCGGNREGVFVLSIPDYGYTPFGISDQERISEEIDQFNAVNYQIALELGIAYFDITPISREAISKPAYLARDNLHPSGEMYARWVDLIMEEIEINSITSIDPLTELTEPVVVYPNPVQDILRIDLPENAHLLEIYNSQGAKCGSWKTAGRQGVSIDVSSWSNGMYFFRIAADGAWIWGKLVKD